LTHHGHDVTLVAFPKSMIAGRLTFVVLGYVFAILLFCVERAKE